MIGTFVQTETKSRTHLSKLPMVLGDRPFTTPTMAGEACTVGASAPVSAIGQKPRLNKNRISRIRKASVTPALNPSRAEKAAFLTPSAGGQQGHEICTNSVIARADYTAFLSDYEGRSEFAIARVSEISPLKRSDSAIYEGANIRRLYLWRHGDTYLFSEVTNYDPRANCNRSGILRAAFSGGTND